MLLAGKEISSVAGGFLFLHNISFNTSVAFPSLDYCSVLNASSHMFLIFVSQNLNWQ